MLRALVHDWDESNVLQILRNSARRCRVTAKGLAIECAISPTRGEHTTTEYAELLRAAGFRFARMAPVSVVECEAA
ncbi:hypothetical protein [Mycobacterium sp.]|uniref:hypothetical protein n=1 Tax=Mycobacterium sp. TaxID=1785 RepID=UPI002D8398E2|nr:hypothetical protein [Mycobacterium sp.]